MQAPWNRLSTRRFPKISPRILRATLLAQKMSRTDDVRTGKVFLRGTRRAEYINLAGGQENMRSKVFLRCSFGCANKQRTVGSFGGAVDSVCTATRRLSSLSSPRPSLPAFSRRIKNTRNEGTCHARQEIHMYIPELIGQSIYPLLVRSSRSACVAGRGSLDIRDAENIGERSIHE